MIMISIILLSFSLSCYSQGVFLTKLPTLGFLFSKVVRAAVVAKLLVLDILSLAFILALRVILVVSL